MNSWGRFSPGSLLTLVASLGQAEGFELNAVPLISSGFHFKIIEILLRKSLSLFRYWGVSLFLPCSFLAASRLRVLSLRSLIQFEFVFHTDKR